MRLKNINLLTLSVFLFLSCSNQTSQKDLSPAGDQRQILEDKLNNYFISLSDWSELAPNKKSENIKVGDASVTDEKLPSDQGLIPGKCTTQKYDMTSNPDKIIMQDPAVAILYPGALIQGEGYLQGMGNLRELPIRKRAPLVIATNLANENNAIKIDQLNYATYQTSYAKLITSANSAQLKIPAKISFKQIEANNSEQAALSLGISAKQMGNSLSGAVDTKSSSSEKTFMVYFEQNAFTVSAVAPATPAGFFAGDFSESDLKNQIKLGNIKTKNPPLYVSSVSYGRILIYTVTSKASRDDIKAALNGSYNNGLLKVEADVKAKYQKIMNESTVKIIAFGGDKKHAETLIKNGNLSEYFSETTSLESYLPISYVLRNIKDNSIAKASETTAYETVECLASAPKSWTVKITVEKILMHYTGAYSKGEIYGDLSLGGIKLWSRTEDQYESTKNEAALKYQPEQNTLEFILPVPDLENKITAQPVLLTGKLMDNDDMNEDDKVAQFKEFIGYTKDQKDVRESGTYSTETQKNVEIFYKLERIKPNY